MRRLTGGEFSPASLLLLVAALLLAPLACKQHPKRVARSAQDELLLDSMISTVDPRSTNQLSKGFYPVDPGVSWRWTAKNFNVSLSPPRGAAQKGAELVLELAVPDPVIQRLKSITLSSSIGGLQLAPEKYTAAGTYTYTRDVPADHLQASRVAVDFALDNALPPSGDETRELGIIVTRVGFKIKE